MIESVTYTGFEITNKEDLKTIRTAFDIDPSLKNNFKLSCLYLSSWIFVGPEREDGVGTGENESLSSIDDDGSCDDEEDEEDEDDEKLKEEKTDSFLRKLYHQTTNPRKNHRGERKETAEYNKRLWDFFENNFEFCEKYAIFILYSKMKHNGSLSMEIYCEQSPKHSRKAKLDWFLASSETEQEKIKGNFLQSFLLKKFSLVFDNRYISDTIYGSIKCDWCEVYDKIHCKKCYRCYDEKHDDKIFCSACRKCDDVKHEFRCKKCYRCDTVSHNDKIYCEKCYRCDIIKHDDKFFCEKCRVCCDETHICKSRYVY